MNISIIIFIVVAVNYTNANWWYLGIQSEKDTGHTLDTNKADIAKKHCLNSKIFSTPNQRQICLKNAKIAAIVKRGAKLAIDECQYQFKLKRWNCSIYNQTDVFGHLVKTRSREQAFIYAITASAAMYEITRSCSRGDLKKCSCDNTDQSKRINGSNGYFRLTKADGQNYEWRGCSENVLFGYRLSKNFVDSKELQDTRLKNKDQSYMSKEMKLMNLHNNEVGRRVILKNMKQVCKCHGVSGSCSIKVCWKVMPSFRVIGEQLMKRFKIASQIKETRVKERIKKLNQIVSRRYSRNSAESSLKDDLIFIDKSPNFCHKKMQAVSNTSGRQCGFLNNQKSNSTNISNEIENKCEYLCCGRGYVSKIIETEEDCECSFQWCCSVKCKKCKKTITEYYCK